MTEHAHPASGMTPHRVFEMVGIATFASLEAWLALRLGQAATSLEVAGIFSLGIVTQILAIAFQGRLMDLSPSAPSLGASLCHSGLNIANAAGAWLGGLVLAAGYGNLAPAWVGFCLTIVGGLMFLFSLRSRRGPAGT